jgi:hypothetical protein
MFLNSFPKEQSECVVERLPATGGEAGVGFEFAEDIITYRKCRGRSPSFKALLWWWTRKIMTWQPIIGDRFLDGDIINRWSNLPFGLRVIIYGSTEIKLRLSVLD